LLEGEQTQSAPPLPSGHSIDFFLKTEIDKTVIDLYDKFKANAPSIAFVPDPSDLTRSDYDDIRAFLNICELIAVGVNKGAFSKSVSEAYWGDVIPEAYQTAKQLINNIRTTPGEGLYVVRAFRTVCLAI
jgi:hypothetical protein